MKSIATIVVAFVLFGCASTEDPGFTSVTTSGETGETGETGEDPTPNCANPEFEQEVEEPTVSTCVGQGGGALVFDVFSGIGNGVIPDRSKPAPTVFFSDDPDDAAVGACCGAAASPDEVAGACESDCGRAACNIAIATLEDAVADPSSLQGDGCGEDCAVNVAMSMEEWVLPQLKTRTGYDACVAMAELNDDPDVDYTSPEYDGEQLTFQKPADACMNFGCLSNVRLRIYCAVDSILATDQVCEMATNDENTDIPESDRLIVSSSPTEVTTGSKGHAETFVAMSHGGALRQAACDEPSCPVVLESFSLSTDDTVNIGPLHAWNLTATLDYAAVGTRTGDTVTFDTGALQFRISGVSSKGKKGIQLPLEFVIANTSPATATFTGATFAFDELEFRQGQDELRLRVHQASVTPSE